MCNLGALIHFSNTKYPACPLSIYLCDRPHTFKLCLHGSPAARKQDLKYIWRYGVPNEAILSGGETELTQCDDFYGIVDSCHTSLPMPEIHWPAILQTHIFWQKYLFGCLQFSYQTYLEMVLLGKECKTMFIHSLLFILQIRVLPCVIRRCQNLLLGLALQHFLKPGLEL